MGIARFDGRRTPTETVRIGWSWAVIVHSAYALPCSLLRLPYYIQPWHRQAARDRYHGRQLNNLSDARKGVTGKSGGNPARSRHCKWEATPVQALDELVGEGWGSVEGLTFLTHEPGDLSEAIWHCFSAR